jgi:opacity protein-like surface antigen
MRRFACVFAVLVLASMSLSAVAQRKTNAASSSKLSVFGGYSLLHYNNGTDPARYGAGELDNTANANGFVAAVAYDLSRTVALVGEYGFYHAGSVSNTGLPSGISAKATAQTYLFGPKISHRSGPITPFAQALFGGMHATFGESGSFSGTSISVTSPGANAFALAVGGGLDWKVTSHVSIRPAQFEYLMSRFTNSNTFTDSGVPRPGDGGNGMQNNFRYSAGLVFNF